MVVSMGPKYLFSYAALILIKIQVVQEKRQLKISQVIHPWLAQKLGVFGFYVGISMMPILPGLCNYGNPMVHIFSLFYVEIFNTVQIAARKFSVTVEKVSKVYESIIVTFHSA